MGCDIHFFVERRKGPDAPWEIVPTSSSVYDEHWGDDDWDYKLADRDQPYDYNGRNYDLFAILADVRNGRGFAGVKTGDGFNPIAPQRGVPDDASAAYKQAVEHWEGDGHSHSHHTARQLLEYDWDQQTHHQGLFDLDSWTLMRLHGKPYTWSGGLWSKTRQDVSNERMDELCADALKRVEGVPVEEAYRVLLAHDAEQRKQRKEDDQPPMYVTSYRWAVSYKDACERFHTKTIPGLLELGDRDHVRILFFFDN